MRHLRRLFSPERIFLWLLCAFFFYVLGQARLYGQLSVSPASAETPWEHLTLEAALALAVGVQYRENRQKEAIARQLATEAAAAIAKATQMMVDVTQALERLNQKVEGTVKPRSY